MVTGGHSFIQVINKSKMGIMEYIRFLHDTDTPVKICREPILQVVWLYQITAGEKGLMQTNIPCLKLFQVSVAGADRRRMYKKCP